MIRTLCVLILLAVSLQCGIVHAQKVAYGGLYVSGGSTSQNATATAAKVTGFAASQPTDGGDKSIVANVSADTISLLSGGVYLIQFDVTAELGTADVQIYYTLRNGATAITGAKCKLEAEATGVPTNTSMSILFKPTAAATLSVYHESETGTVAVTPTDMQLTVIRIQ